MKGIVVGFGGILPGLSGSILLVIFGLYQDTVNALGTLMKNLKKNIIFLLPICLGMVTGVLLFSKAVDFLLNNYEMQTRFAFFGLVLGTIPLFYKEVKKEGFNKKYYILILLSLLFGLFLIMNSGVGKQISELNFLTSSLLGLVVAASSIVPGVDTTVILSSLGLYEAYVSALANINFLVLMPLGLGVLVGVLVVSKIMNLLIKKYYTITFSIIFGFFISIVPSVLTDSCVLGFNFESVISIILMIVCIFISYFSGSIDKIKIGGKKSAKK